MTKQKDMANTTQGKMFLSKQDVPIKQPVVCLGIEFPNDEARREHFLELLKKKLKDPAFRRIEGFPKGSDEAILALSDPPYYTACPNPFVSDYIAHVRRNSANKQEYKRLPYPAALEDSRNNPFVNAHSYATKVPHEAVMRLLLHYTEPGDVVLDGFVGTGMTAVGAQLCGDLSTVEGLGYTIDPKTLSVLGKNGKEFSHLGGRYAIVSDLCPAATHLSYNFNFPFDHDAFETEIEEMVAAVKQECGWMYQTRHGKSGFGEIVCVLWSDVFICGNCNQEIIFWDSAVDLHCYVFNELITCDHCAARARKTDLEPAWTTIYDLALQKTVRQVKQVPVVIIYEALGKRFEKAPDDYDLKVLRRISESTIPDPFPLERMPRGFNTDQPEKSHNLTHIHQFFTKRNLWALACAWKHAKSWRARFLFTSMLYRSSVLCSPKMSNYFAEKKGNPRGGWIGTERSGTLYCAAIHSEVAIPPQIVTRRRAVAVTAASKTLPILGVSSATQIGVDSDSIDYIFTDPPFGGNKMYSELAFMWESWLGVFTNNELEAIQNGFQNKGLPEYEQLMTRCFVEYHRVLKPGRWITVEFSNTEAAVWNALQNSISKAGFVIADVRDLNKQQGSTLGYTTTTATRQDLAISAYKPDSRLENSFRVKRGDEASVWDFIRSHLQKLQVTDVSDSSLKISPERQPFVLFDRMVGFNVQRGLPVPLSSAEFQKGLRQRFPERDGMYFLSEQIAEYEMVRMKANSVEQIPLFVSDEKSAIQWIRQQLEIKPMTEQKLQPLYLKEAQRVWEKHEQPLELRTVLQENFVEDADGKWHAPDPNKEAHLEQIRNRALLREYQQYVGTKGKLRIVRTEALRAGFQDCWQRKDYTTIVQMAKRVPESAIQEDPALLMYFDNASLLIGE